MGNGSTVSGNSQQDFKHVTHHDPDPVASYESEGVPQYKSKFMSKSDPECHPNYKSKLEADSESEYDSEAESEANYECNAVDGHYALQCRSAPAAISMALNSKKDEAQSVPTDRAILSSHHSSLPVNIEDQGIAEVHSAQQDAAGEGSAGLQSKQLCLTALIPSLQRVMRSSTGTAAAASPSGVKAAPGGQAAAAAILANPPDSKPAGSNLCKPMQRVKKLVLKVRPSCTHSHQQEEDAQPWPAAAAAVHCVSKLTGLFEPKKTASMQAPLGAAESLAAQSLQEAEAAEPIPALRQLAVAQQAGQSPQLQVTTTAAAKPAIQVSSLHNSDCLQCHLILHNVSNAL